MKNKRKMWLGANAYRVVWISVLVGGVALVIALMAPCLVEPCWTGGSLTGLFFGLAGFIGIVLSTLYVLRKDRPRFDVFALKHWLYGHVVIGTLSLYLIVAHSGFRLQNVPATIALAFLALTVISGVAGMGLFYYMPHAQSKHEASVLIPADLCKRLSRFHEEISEICSNKGDVFLDVYNQLVIPVYRTRVGKPPPNPDVSPWAELVDDNDMEDFVNLAAKLEAVHDMLVLLGQNLRFRWMIRAWLILHVPATIGLIVFSAVHIISIVWYGVP